METIYTVIVVIFTGSGQSSVSTVVGVSNDAVNFLNSAIGSKSRLPAKSSLPSLRSASCWVR